MVKNKKAALIPNRIKMSVDEVVSLQQAMQEILIKEEEISNYDIYAKTLKMFILWAKLESQEYGSKMNPLDDIEHIIRLMKSGELEVELVE